MCWSLITGGWGLKNALQQGPRRVLYGMITCPRVAWRIPADVVKENFPTAKASDVAIEFAVDLLSYYVKALADVSYGRDGNDQLIPADLFGQSSTDKHGRENVEVTRREEEMSKTRKRLFANRCSQKGQRARPPRVTIPKVNEGSFDVTKIRFRDTGTRDSIPDPANLLYKAAINWSFRNAEKPIPACQEHELDSEDEELYDIAHAEAMASLLPRLPPSEIQIDERTARRETLSPFESCCLTGKHWTGKRR